MENCIIMNSEETVYKYALKCIYNAHTSDIRVVKPTCFPEGGLVTGSRDHFVKVWAPDGKSFKESNLFFGATNFISSLCVLPPSAQYPKGLFLAGSHDCSIYGFTPDSSEPVLRLLGHSGTVCSLSSGKFGFIVSGSWDKTARVWSGQQCILTLQGHLQAVWATDVFPTQNVILTGSADHTIRMWRTGICEKVFKGHEDCVRGLAIISDMKFLSCSNDNTVRLWLTSGECLEVYKSHTDYIYSITLLNNGTDFATCSEDQNIKIWKNGICIQTVVIAPKSLWSVACLTNGDLAVGTSEGKMYVFEKVPVDYFEKALVVGEGFNALNSHSNGDNKDAFTMLEGVPDIRSSIYDGEIVITYENQSSNMYVCHYNYANGSKVKKEAFNLQVINDALCKKPVEVIAGSSEVSEKKFDYEFDVDVENSIYKLALNKGDNPWEVASKFVAEHNLLSEHIGQIVEYIIQNTVNTFTNEFFPTKVYLTYLNVNITGLREKLLEFCNCESKENCLTPLQVDDLIVLAHFPEEVSLEQMAALDKAISWNDDLIYPVLDLLRLAVRCEGLREKISSKEFVNHLLFIFVTSKRSINRVLIQKILCNMFGIEEAETVLAFYQEKIFECVKNAFSTGDLKIQKSGSSLFLNFAIASYNGFNISTYMFCLNAVEILNYLVAPEAIYRSMLAIGTSCTRNEKAVAYFRSLNIKELLSKFEYVPNHPKLSHVLILLLKDM